MTESDHIEHVVVLEASGEHWTIRIPAEKLGQDLQLARRLENPALLNIYNKMGLPVYKLITYRGNQFIDERGKIFWIYSEAKS